MPCEKPSRTRPPSVLQATAAPVQLPGGRRETPACARGELDCGLVAVRSVERQERREGAGRPGHEIEFLVLLERRRRQAGRDAPGGVERALLVEESRNEDEAVHGPPGAGRTADATNHSEPPGVTVRLLERRCERLQTQVSPAVLSVDACESSEEDRNPDRALVQVVRRRPQHPSLGLVAEGESDPGHASAGVDGCGLELLPEQASCTEGSCFAGGVFARGRFAGAVAVDRRVHGAQCCTHQGQLQTPVLVAERFEAPAGSGNRGVAEAKERAAAAVEQPFCHAGGREEGRIGCLEVALLAAMELPEGIRIRPVDERSRERLEARCCSRRRSAGIGGRARRSPPERRSVSAGRARAPARRAGRPAVRRAPEARRGDRRGARRRRGSRYRSRRRRLPGAGPPPPRAGRSRTARRSLPARPCGRRPSSGAPTAVPGRVRPAAQPRRGR